MGAYWQVIFPTRILIPKTSTQDIESFEKRAAGLYTKKNQTEFVCYNIGKRAKNRFRAFYKVFLTHAFAESRRRGYLNCDHDEHTPESVMATLKEVDPFATDVVEQLSRISENYYLSVTDICQFIVYDGWPFKVDARISGFVLLNSDAKYQESAEALPIMNDIIAATRKEFPDLANLLFVCAY
jgi:hypothetical protein